MSYSPTDYGFRGFEGAEAVKELSIDKVIEPGEILKLNVPEHDIVHKKAKEILAELTKEIIEQKAIRFRTYKSLDGSITVHGDVMVAPPGTKMIQVHNDRFIVGTEEFDEDDIATALQLAYPERFI